MDSFRETYIMIVFNLYKFPHENKSCHSTEGEGGILILVQIPLALASCWHHTFLSAQYLVKHQLDSNQIIMDI